MVNRNLLAQFDTNEDEINDVFGTVPGSPEEGDWLPEAEQHFEVNKIVNGKVMSTQGDDVVIDVGYKSEGIIPLNEWHDEGTDKVTPPQPGDQIQVLLEAVEDEGGSIVLSYKKAKR